MNMVLCPCMLSKVPKEKREIFILLIVKVHGRKGELQSVGVMCGYAKSFENMKSQWFMHVCILVFIFYTCIHLLFSPRSSIIFVILWSRNSIIFVHVHVLLPILILLNDLLLEYMSKDP